MSAAHGCVPPSLNRHSSLRSLADRGRARRTAIRWAGVLGCLLLAPLGNSWGQERLNSNETLPNTALLKLDGPLDEVMVAGIDRYALRALAQSKSLRDDRWKDRNLADAAAHRAWLEPVRARLRTSLGAVDTRVPAAPFRELSHANPSGKLAAGTHVGTNTDRYSIAPIVWDVFPGVHGAGLLLTPRKPIAAMAIAIPDASWTPEEFCGADPDRPEMSPLVRRLVEQEDCLVVIPTLVSRDNTFSGNPAIGVMTNQTHREWVYRQAFELGRQVIGYEVQKVLAAVDALQVYQHDAGLTLPIVVAGVGEGGLLAMHAAALDDRIAGTLVSGYFRSREGAWQEPIERNVWRLLTEFGDAEVASMSAPRPLVIEAAAIPELTTPLPVPAGRRGGAAPGSLQIAPLQAVIEEFARPALKAYSALKAADHVQLIVSEEPRPVNSTAAAAAAAPQTPVTPGTGNPGTQAAVAKLMQLVHQRGDRPRAALPLATAPLKVAALPDTAARQQQQVTELVAHTQNLLRHSHRVRDQLWKGADRSSVEKWEASADHYRKMVYDELIGRIDEPYLPPQPRTRLILDAPEYRGFEVVLDVFPDVIAGGILLLPKDLKEGERRPVVVCQHGLEGVPMDTIVGPPDTKGYPYYKAFAVELAKRGFITYAPQNPYRGHDRFRTLQRKSNLLGRSLFSYIIPQHQVTLHWLATLPNVDAERIAFYGLSYGGKTAVRVPPMLKEYCLSICSADFNEWVSKNASIDEPFCYVFTPEYEIFEWNMGHVANYAELSKLMAPRPFMVERGHDDGVGIDEWVAHEYAKVRYHYVKLGLEDRTMIEFFNGPHTINGQLTYSFLHHHLNFRRPR